MNRKIKTKISELQESAKKVTSTAKQLKILIKNIDNINDVLLIQHISSTLLENLFGSLQTLEQFADEHARKIFP